MRTFVAVVLILAISAPAGLAQDHIEKKPQLYEMTLDPGVLLVVVTEWQGYIGNSPNKSLPIDALIALAKARYKKYRILSVTKESVPCQETGMICQRRAYLLFYTIIIGDVK